MKGQDYSEIRISKDALLRCGYQVEFVLGLAIRMLAVAGVFRGDAIA